MHQPKPPFECSSGPRTAKIALVGEAFGEQEERIERPFIGQAGQELTRILDDAGITRHECFLTNVLALRPPNNKLEGICGNKAEVGGETYKHNPLSQGKYLLPEYLPELDRLREELTIVQPNLVVALGNTACWALLGTAAIKSLRGVTSVSTLLPGVKILPTYHPAAILYNWPWRPIAVADLMKAKREMAFPEIRRPQRWVLVNPTMSEIWSWIKKPFHTAMAVDIETYGKQITCVGFARSRADAICIPFVDYTQDDRNYWRTSQEEVEARMAVQQLLSLPVPKIFQNGLYDLQYLLRDGFRPKMCTEDTMLLHHSLYPEMEKSLGFLGSIYTDEAAWKLLRKRKKDEEFKAND